MGPGTIPEEFLDFTNGYIRKSLYLYKSCELQAYEKSVKLNRIQSKGKRRSITIYRQWIDASLDINMKGVQKNTTYAYEKTIKVTV